MHVRDLDKLNFVKFAQGNSIEGSSKFLLLSQLSQKILLALSGV